MRKVAIITDSTAYLPPEYLKKYDLTVVPLALIWGDKAYSDGVDMTPAEFYTRLENSKVMPTTSQPSIPTLQKEFTRLLECGFDVLGIFISSRLSGTVDSALQARQMVAKDADKIVIIDSLATTLAMGMPILVAARAAEAGEDLASCAKIAEFARDHTDVLFVVESLEYLRRGGRIGGAQALLGTALGIKPVLGLKDGRIISVEKIRTKKKAIASMLDLVEERINGKTPVRLGAVHASAEAESLEMLETARQRFKPVETFHSVLSPVIGSHVGPGTVSLAFMTGVA